MLADIFKSTVNLIFTLAIILVVVLALVLFFGLSSPRPETVAVPAGGTGDIEMETAAFPEAGDFWESDPAQNRQHLEQEQLNLAEVDRLLKQISQREQARIEERYQQMIAARKEELARELDFFAAELEQEQKQQLRQKRETLTRDFQEEVREIRQTDVPGLQELEKELLEEHFGDIFRLSLKLETLRLSARERRELQEELAQIDRSLREQIEEVEDDFRRQLEEQVAAREREYEQRLDEYRRQLEREKEEKLLARQREHEQQLQEFSTRQKQRMEAEIEQRRAELQRRLEEDRARRQQLVADIFSRYRTLEPEEEIDDFNFEGMEE